MIKKTTLRIWKKIFYSILKIIFKLIKYISKKYIKYSKNNYLKPIILINPLYILSIPLLPIKNVICLVGPKIYCFVCLFRYSLITHLLALTIFFSCGGYAEARSIPEDIRSILNQAEFRYEIPTGLLYAIAASESNFYTHAIGIKGKPIFCKSLIEAKSYLFAAFKDGITNIDIGIMQINWHWHAHEFLTIEEMFLPESNI